MHFPNVALYTDFYQLTMAQGYFLAQKTEDRAFFDYFFRSLPFSGGYVVFAGLADVLTFLQESKFSPEHIDYLHQFGFQSDFLEYLKTFQFTGTLRSVQEGELVFPFTPVVQVSAPMIEAQIIETMLLNILNFESLIATKSMRMQYAAKGKRILEFGLRRAQGLGGLQASKAAIIGGAVATSNVLAGYEYDLPVSGTMAHAWIQSFDDELTAFRFYAKIFPDNCTFLVDTYDTLKSGVPNAITVAKELEAQGKRANAIRLDSGDLAVLSRSARQMLDEAGLEYMKIAATNELDEHLIRSLEEQGACIDVYGVGTRLVTAKDQPALGGVYKLIQVNDEPRVKISENVVKISLPGVKTLYRYRDAEGFIAGDAICLMGENPPMQVFHPHVAETVFDFSGLTAETLHHNFIENGTWVSPIPTAEQSASLASERFRTLKEACKRFDYPQVYPVGISEKLLELRAQLIQEKRKGE